MFARRRQRDAALVKAYADNLALQQEILALRNQVKFLIDTIRKTDDAIFTMSQQTSLDGMRPAIQALVEAMTIRKRTESNRIGALLETELRQTYDPGNRLALEHGR